MRPGCTVVTRQWINAAIIKQGVNSMIHSTKHYSVFCLFITDAYSYIIHPFIYLFVFHLLSTNRYIRLQICQNKQQ